MILRFFFFFLFFPFFIYSKSIIVTSVYPLKLIIDEIVPENISVFNVIPENANPHFFEVSPKSALIIKKAEIFIGVQKDFDGWIESFLNSKCKIFYLNKAGKNPHIWLSPKIIMEKLRIFVNIFPEKRKIIIKKTEIFKKKLTKILNKYEFNNLKIIELHPAWDYFAKDFNIKIVGTLIYSEHNEVSLKRVLKLIEIAKKEKVKLIFASKNIHNEFLITFAKKINAKILYLDPLGEGEKSYFEFLKNICKKIFYTINEQ